MSRAVLSAIETARATGDWSHVIANIPYAQFLGLSVEARGDELICAMRFHDSLIGNPSIPALHGGTTGALLESAAIFQLLAVSKTDVLPKTINITVDYLRSGRPVDTFARGIVTKHGRRVANVRVEAWQDDIERPIATANAHFLIGA